MSWWCASCHHLPAMVCASCSIYKPGTHDQGDHIGWGTRGTGCAGHNRRCGLLRADVAEQRIAWAAACSYMKATVSMPRLLRHQHSQRSVAASTLCLQLPRLPCRAPQLRRCAPPARQQWQLAASHAALLRWRQAVPCPWRLSGARPPRRHGRRLGCGQPTARSGWRWPSRPLQGGDGQPCHFGPQLRKLRAGGVGPAAAAESHPLRPPMLPQCIHTPACRAVGVRPWSHFQCIGSWPIPSHPSPPTDRITMPPGCTATLALLPMTLGNARHITFVLAYRSLPFQTSTLLPFQPLIGPAKAALLAMGSRLFPTSSCSSRRFPSPQQTLTNCATAPPTIESGQLAPILPPRTREEHLLPSNRNT